MKSKFEQICLESYLTPRSWDFILWSQFPESCSVLYKGDCSLHAFPGGSVVKHPPASVGDASFGDLGGEDPLEKQMATHSSIPAWKIPRTWRGRGWGLQSMGSHRVGQPWTTEHARARTHHTCRDGGQAGWSTAGRIPTPGLVFFFFLYNINKGSFAVLGPFLSWQPASEVPLPSFH